MLHPNEMVLVRRSGATRQTLATRAMTEADLDVMRNKPLAERQAHYEALAVQITRQNKALLGESA